MVGKDYQRHICSMPYGNYHGTSLSSVSSVRNRKNKNDKGHIKETIKQLEQLLEQGVQPKSIARQLELNHSFSYGLYSGEI